MPAGEGAAARIATPETKSAAATSAAPGREIAPDGIGRSGLRRLSSAVSQQSLSAMPPQYKRVSERSGIVGSVRLPQRMAEAPALHQTVGRLETRQRATMARAEVMRKDGPGEGR